MHALFLDLTYILQAHALNRHGANWLHAVEQIGYTTPTGWINYYTTPAKHSHSWVNITNGRHVFKLTGRLMTSVEGAVREVA